MGKRGPAPKGEYDNKSAVFSTRIRADTKRAIKIAADASGRSMSCELEHRLLRSFEEDRLIRERFGCRENYGVLRLIALAIELECPQDPKRWLFDSKKFAETLAAIEALLQSFDPKPRHVDEPHRRATPKELPWGDLFLAAQRTEGVNVASMLIAELKDAPFGLPAPQESQGKRRATVKRIRKGLAQSKDALGAALIDRLSAEAARDRLNSAMDAALWNISGRKSKSRKGG